MSYLVLSKVRPALAVLGFFSAVFFSPLIPLAVMILLAFRYAAWEVLVLGLFVDLLWFTPDSTGGLFGVLPLFTCIGIVLVWSLEPLRSEFLT
jgi:hypothetical protein